METVYYWLCMLQEHKRGETVYYWLYFLLGILIPLIMLAFCNAMLIRALRESMLMRQLHTATSSRSVACVCLRVRACVRVCSCVCV